MKMRAWDELLRTNAYRRISGSSRRLQKHREPHRWFNYERCLAMAAMPADVSMYGVLISRSARYGHARGRCTRTSVYVPERAYVLPQNEQQEIPLYAANSGMFLSDHSGVPRQHRDLFASVLTQSNGVILLNVGGM
jgi:hypothetical protein